jgi:hypothetical protein
MPGAPGLASETWDALPSHRFQVARHPATIIYVEITFDAKKSERNLRERNLSFEQAT